MSSCNICGGYVECHQCMVAHDEARRLYSDEERAAAQRAWDTQRAAKPMPFDRAAVFTIWQGMQYQGGIVTEAQAVLFAQQVLAAHGLGEVPARGVPLPAPAEPSQEQIDAAILNCFALHGLIKNQDALLKAGRALLAARGVLLLEGGKKE